MLVLRPQARKARPGIGGPLVYHGGPVVANAKIFNIFWGSEWLAADARLVLDNLNTAWGFLAGHPAFYDVLRQYSTPSQTIGTGSFIGSLIETSIKLPHPEVFDVPIDQFL